MRLRAGDKTYEVSAYATWRIAIPLEVFPSRPPKRVKIACQCGEAELTLSHVAFNHAYYYVPARAECILRAEECELVI